MKKIKILTIIILIAIITMIAFFGIYTQVQNRMENQVKDFTYAMDLEGSRNIRLKVNTENRTVIKDAEGKEVENSQELTEEQIAEKGYIKEENPYNKEDVKNVENYIKTKEIIEKRLEKLIVENYTIKLDEQTGDIIIEFTENTKTDDIISSLNTTGKFEIIDSQTKEVLMTNSDIKLSNVMYGSGSNQTATSSGTTVYLNIEFTKEGAKKLEDISNKYVKTEDKAQENQTEENAQENQTEETTQIENKITMKIDDDEIMSTNFEEPLRTGKLQLSIGSSTTDQKTLQGYIDQASNMAIVLDNGNFPLIYTLDENQYVATDITKDDMMIVQYVLLGIITLALIVLLIRYKSYGFIGGITYIGFAAILLLIIKYANVVLSLEGIFAIAIVLILNYLFINKILSKIKKHINDISVQEVKNINKETYQEFFLKIIPIIIMVITFCFMKWIPISSFGMVMFWGIALIAIYNSIFTNNLLKIKAKK